MTNLQAHVLIRLLTMFSFVRFLMSYIPRTGMFSRCATFLAAAGSPFVCTLHEASRSWRRTVCFCICSTSWVPFPPSSQEGTILQGRWTERGQGRTRTTRSSILHTTLDEQDMEFIEPGWLRLESSFRTCRIGVKLSAEAEADITDKEVR